VKQHGEKLNEKVRALREKIQEKQLRNNQSLEKQKEVI